VKVIVDLMIKKFQSEESGQSAGGMKSRVTRKHVIIGVTCAVMVAMVITGVLLGVKFNLDSTDEIVAVSNNVFYRNTWMFRFFRWIF